MYHTASRYSYYIVAIAIAVLALFIATSSGAYASSSLRQTTTTYGSGAGINIAIPDGLDLSGTRPGAPTTHDIVITDSDLVTDLNLYLDIHHTFVDDLGVTLTHVDTGTTVSVADPESFNCGGNDVLATLDDESATTLAGQCRTTGIAIQGTFSPDHPLSAFDAESITGTWRITITDYFSQDTGVIYEWRLVATTVPLPVDTPTPIATAAPLVTAAPVAAAPFYPTYPAPPAIPLCADATGSINSIVRADVPGGTVPNGGVFCRVIMQNGAYVERQGKPGDIGNAEALRYTLIQAVDVYGMAGSASVPSFMYPVKVCLQGSGTFLYLDATAAPRVLSILPSASENGSTCATIPHAGTVLLASGG